MTEKKVGARMGRPTKPTEQKRKAGNPGKRPLPEPLQVVPAVEGPPKAPKGLEAAGKAVWAAVWDQGQTWLASSDEILVGLLCETVDEREEWQKIVDDEGWSVTTTRGSKALHPAVPQLRALDQQVVGILSLLGFTPTDRSRLGLTEVKRLTHLADLVTRRRGEFGR